MNAVPPFCYLNSNDHTGLLAAGQGPSFVVHSLEDLADLDTFLDDQRGNYIFGYLSFALQAHVTGHPLSSNLTLPLAYFWVPESVGAVRDEKIDDLGVGNKNSLQDLLAQINYPKQIHLPSFNTLVSKDNYLETVAKIQGKIQRGDLYETNFCIEYFIENLELDDIFGLYHHVNSRTKAPFSVLLYLENLWLACGSPERFMKKTGSTLLSQPIKGTAARCDDAIKDQQSRERLANSSKEKSENVMIVDLVRNDLSKIAAPGSVQVDELCGVYSFPTVHQMISTVSCRLKEACAFSDILKAMFPMGSMTGAPKRNSLMFAKEMENFTREIYSGSVGYFTPDGDFDFNVVIRSLAYDPAKKRLSCGVGSAITMASDPDQEYEECAIKINRLIH